jgi:ATP-dependent Lon protease
MNAGKKILLIAQQKADLDDPQPEDLYDIGTLATILQLLKLPDGTVKVLVEGGERASVDSITVGDHFSAEITILKEESQHDEREIDVLVRSIIAQFEQYVKLNKKVPPEAKNPGTLRHPGPSRADPRHHRGRDRRAADRETHSRPRQTTDGKEPARVLPE